MLYVTAISTVGIKSYYYYYYYLLRFSGAEDHVIQQKLKLKS